MTDTITRHDWYGLYRERWGKELVPDAYAHPAKVARGLARRIYKHLLEQDYIQPGDTIIDPFAGIGGFALDAARQCLAWLGMELESKFCTLARENFIYWAEREWCICGNEGRTYLQAMRQAVSEGIGRGQSYQKTESGTVLQQELQQQLPLQGQTSERRPESQATQADTLEQGATVAQRNAPQNLRGDKQGAKSREEQSELEGRQKHQARRLYRDTGGRPSCARAQTYHGETSGTTTETGRDCASQERRPTRQPTGKLGADDDLRTHGPTSQGRDQERVKGENLHNLRGDISGATQREPVQRKVSKNPTASVLEEVRRKTQSQYCTICGKLIVPFPIILQGDSRELVQVLGRHLETEAGALVSSPYSQTLKGGEGPGARYDFKTHSPDNAIKQTCDPDYGEDPDNLANLPEGDVEAVISSPPYAAGCAHTGGETSPTTGQGGPIRFVEYGESDGQFAAMPEGDIDAVVTSPPYNLPMSQDHSGRGGGDRGHTPSEPGAFARYGNTPGQLEGLPMSEEGLDAVVTSPPFGAGETRDRAPVQPGHVADCMTRSYTQDKQGTTPGNLATMDACVSSPPYEGALGNTREYTDEAKAQADAGRDIMRVKAGKAADTRYSPEPANLGNDTGDNFWEAASAIVHQCHAILKPGAVAVWVVKRFVRDKAIVEFPDQWRQMCEAAGFETVEWIRAWLVEERGTQIDLWDNDHQRQVSRKSFFRRLYESKYPENSIDWEDVIIMRKSKP